MNRLLPLMLVLLMPACSLTPGMTMQADNNLSDLEVPVMKYCTLCSAEYRDDIGICSDCGAALVGQKEWDSLCRMLEPS